MRCSGSAHRFGAGRVGRWLVAFASASLLANVALADLVIPAGGSTSLGGGAFDLGCTDVIVSGTLDLAGGTLSNVRNVVINTGGVVTAGAGRITLAGNWTNAGSFNAGTGTVSFADAPGCAATSTITGNSTFFRLSVVSATGKLYRFASGSQQRVVDYLTMLGTPANPLRVETTTAGATADIDLSGNQSMGYLAVRDMTASGQWLALGQVNYADGATVRWFGYPVVPVNSLPLLLGSALALLLIGTRRQKQQQSRSARH